MKSILLHNWKAKLASLFLAVGIWFLIRMTIPEPAAPVFPVPGTSPPSSSEPPPVPGVPGPLGGLFPAVHEEVVMAPHTAFYRLHWIEAGDFAVSLVEFPPRAVA